MALPVLLFWIAAAAVAALAIFVVVKRLQTEKIVALAEKAAPAVGKFVEVDGCSIHYLEKGEGRSILFVHGLGGWLQHLSFPLFGLIDGYRLVAVDRPGSGRSTRPGDRPATIADQAAFLMHFAECMGMERPLVVGHSLGGAIALRMALDFPGKIAGLALISSLTRYEAEVPPSMKPLLIPNALVRRLIAETISAPAAIKATAEVLDVVFGPQAPPPDYGTAGAALAALRPSHFYAASTDTVAIGDTMQEQEKRYGSLDLPVGMLYGSADRVIDGERQSAGLVGRLSRLDIEIVEGVGHMPQFAEPQRVAAFVKRMAERAFAA